MKHSVVLKVPTNKLASLAVNHLFHDLGCPKVTGNF